jgi:hypothetical protein
VTEAEEKTRSQLKFRRAEKTIIKIIDEEWARGKISPQDLKGGCLRRKVSGLRAAIAKWVRMNQDCHWQRLHGM